MGGFTQTASLKKRRKEGVSLYHSSLFVCSNFQELRIGCVFDERFEIRFFQDLLTFGKHLLTPLTHTKTPVIWADTGFSKT